jgi:hypothetical protein
MGSAFLDSLSRNILRVEKEVDAKCFAIFQELASTVVYNCPVLRGNLINDFWPAVNGYNYTVRTVVDKEGQSQIQPHSDTTGSGSISRIRDVQGKGTFVGKDGFLSFSTSVPYAYRIEYEGWSERKAPTGFVRNSLTTVAAKHR